MAQLSDRQQKKFAILRVICAMGERISDEMRIAARTRLGSLELQVLMLIDQHPGLTQSDLAARVHRTAVQVSRMVDELEASGLVMRRPHQFDRRSKGLLLTEEGAVVGELIRARAIQIASEAFGSLSDDDLDMLIRHTADVAERLHLSVTDRGF